MNISEDVFEKLRGCQQESLKTISTYLSSRSEKSCLISLPTGAGKSGVICVASHNAKSKHILVLTHRRPVCDQLVRQLKGAFHKKILGDEVDISTLKSVFKNIDNFQKEGIYCTIVNPHKKWYDLIKP
jgi:superfamily II DNA or RNA helicase